MKRKLTVAVSADLFQLVLEFWILGVLSAQLHSFLELRRVGLRIVLGSEEERELCEERRRI